METVISEGNSGTQRLYFLLEFNGERIDPDQWLSIDYATRDGNAVAVKNYLPVADTLTLYPGEGVAQLTAFAPSLMTTAGSLDPVAVVLMASSSSNPLVEIAR